MPLNAKSIKALIFDYGNTLVEFGKKQIMFCDMALGNALDQASQDQFGAPLGCIGQGGTIPLMGMLQRGFPQAQMMVCGVLGPKSNAHGPNEFLHIGYGKKLTAAARERLYDAITAKALAWAVVRIEPARVVFWRAAP